MGKKEKHIPMRRCIGCGVSKKQSSLNRIYMREEKLRVDVDRSVEGRGIYLCKSEQCLEKAYKKKSFERFLKRQISEEIKRNFKKELGYE